MKDAGRSGGRECSAPGRAQTHRTFYNQACILSVYGTMLARQFPDLQWLKKQANTSFSYLKAINGRTLADSGWPNVVMNAKASRTVRDGIKGPLSLFANRSGESIVTVDRRRVVVRPGMFFVSNAGQYYSLEIGNTPAETVNIHFGEAFSDSALRSMHTSPEQQLDGKDNTHSPSFFNRLIGQDPALSSLLGRIITPGRSALEEETDLYDILAWLVRDETVIHQRRAQLAALKASTRTELMKRMLTVTDYLYSMPAAQPDLDELARISCLSKFHFLRLFKLAFGQTPHQFVTAVKINRARALLRDTPADVRTIAVSLGYADASTFSRTFHRHVGVYPSQFRFS